MLFALLLSFALCSHQCSLECAMPQPPQFQNRCLNRSPNKTRTQVPQVRCLFVLVSRPGLSEVRRFLSYRIPVEKGCLTSTTGSSPATSLFSWCFSSTFALRAPRGSKVCCCFLETLFGCLRLCFFFSSHILCFIFQAPHN